jgi:hypothetical protein
MKSWSRETSWRQGCVLKESTATAFGLLHESDPACTCVMVVSHDCDLANENLVVEPDVEVIVGRKVDKEDGNYAWAKAPRTLHLRLQEDGADRVVELVTTRKRTIPKSALAVHEPDAAFVLDSRGLNVLREWLSSRYQRAAFPDTFVERMKHTDADRRLAKALREYGAHISFVFFKLKGGIVERAAGDPYVLDVVLVYPEGDDAEEAMDAAEQAASKVDSVLRARLTDPSVIKLRDCITLCESEITIAQSRQLTQWRLEYMTLSADDEQPGMPLH